MIPGARLLKLALKLISAQTVSYLQYTGRALNSDGDYINAYADPVLIRGSFQFVDKKLYSVYGLDLEKIYATFYTETNIQVLKRDISGDKIIFDNKNYQCKSNNDWFKVDGWMGALCYQVK